MTSAILGRQLEWEALCISRLCGQNVLALGDPGTGKTQLAREFARACGTGFARFSLSAYTRPEDLFGAIDLAQYQQGRWVRVSQGRIGDPAIGVVVLDEVSRASGAVRDMLLQALEERIVDGTPVPTMFVGTTNFLPDDEEDRAFLDRFSLTIPYQPLPQHLRLRMLARETDEYPDPVEPIPLDEIPTLDARTAESLCELAAVAGWSDRRLYRASLLVGATQVWDALHNGKASPLRLLYYMVENAHHELVDRLIDPDTAELRVALREIREMREQAGDDPHRLSEVLIACRSTLVKYQHSTSPLVNDVRQVREEVLSLLGGDV